MPEGRIADVPALRIIILVLLFGGVNETTRGQRASLAPAIAIVVDARDEIRIIRQVNEVLRVHDSCTPPPRRFIGGTILMYHSLP